MPRFDELTPEHVIKVLKMKNNSSLWKQILNFCPELEYKSQPKDRDFFFNILNTIENQVVETMVYNAYK